MDWRYLFSFLSARSSNSQADISDGNSADDSEGDKRWISYKIGDVDVHRTLIEFGRCPVSGSVADGSLRSIESMLRAKEIGKALSTYGLCSHCPSISCDNCRKISSSQIKRWNPFYLLLVP